jgi:hypothetical protein
MRKPITPFAHGVLDYATVAMLSVAPRLFSFPSRAAAASYTLAGAYAGLSAVTDYPLAVRRAVPFKAHGIAEAAIGLVLPTLPWMLGFGSSRAARNFFLGLTAMTAATALATDWNKESERTARRRHRRRPGVLRSA